MTMRDDGWGATHASNKAEGVHYKKKAVTVDLLDIAPDIPFALGNTLKYLIRAGTKEGESYADDMSKARVYAKAYLNYVEEPWSYDNPVRWNIICDMLPLPYNSFLSDINMCKELMH